MKTARNRIVVIACVALCIVVIAVITLYRPMRHIVIEVEGPASRNYEAVLIVDGQRQMQTVTLPKTFRFYAREVSYRVTPSDTSADNEMSGHMYIQDKSVDFSCTGWGVGGRIKCPNVLGIGRGDFEGTAGPKDSPGLAETSK